MIYSLKPLLFTKTWACHLYLSAINCTHVWWLIWYTSRFALSNYIVIAFSLKKRAKRRVVALSSCRPASSKARQMGNCRAARCPDVALSLGL
jgi:hypothetical protein